MEVMTISPVMLGHWGSQVTVNENHSYKAIASPYAAAGVLEKNPIHEDMVAAARAVNVQFTFNVALDGEKKMWTKSSGAKASLTAILSWSTMASPNIRRCSSGVGARWRPVAVYSYIFCVGW